MLVKVDLQHQNGKTESLIFGHEKGGRSWKDSFSYYVQQIYINNRLDKEAPVVLPKILKIEQANGNSPKNLWWCRPSDWIRLTKEALPKFKEATSRTKSAVEKKFEETSKGKDSEGKKRYTGTGNSDNSDGREEEAVTSPD